MRTLSGPLRRMTSSVAAMSRSRSDAVSGAAAGASVGVALVVSIA
jgi:hypothetical protein